VLLPVEEFAVRIVVQVEAEPGAVDALLGSDGIEMLRSLFFIGAKHVELWHDLTVSKNATARVVAGQGTDLVRNDAATS
jgi:hypothetical protein